MITNQELALWRCELPGTMFNQLSDTNLHQTCRYPGRNQNILENSMPFYLFTPAQQHNVTDQLRKK